MDGVEGAPGTLPGTDALYENAPCGLLLTGIDGTIRRANRTFCGWVGHAAEELVGARRLTDLLTMGGRIFHQTHWAPLMQMQGSVAEVKLDIRHRDGRTVPMVLNAIRRQHAGGVFDELAIFVAQDRHTYEVELVRARKRAEELLAQQREVEEALKESQVELSRQRARAEHRATFAEQMVGIVSHDLRNPLQAIHMSAHVLGRGDLSTQQRRGVERITNSTQRAQRLIDDLLDFTQARVGRGLTVEPKPIDLHATVADSVEELTHTFAECRLEHRRVGEGACSGDADRLSQVIGNLVANAATYGAKDRPIVVTSRLDPGTFSLAVHNEGEPVSAEALAGLFEPMTRGTSSTGSGRSVGLGLFIVREIARAHGGDVVVESTGAAGTTFTVTCPR
jgi:sigma-B regulation protein RsbU (phosphoserine phosphatase)